MTIRKSGKWQSVWDDRILEVIYYDQIYRVGAIADHDLIRVGQPQVSRRCKKMAEYGLLRDQGNGVYAIHPRGIDYLHGQYDAAGGPPSNNDYEGEREERQTLDKTPENAAKDVAESLNDDNK
ncbi:MarR family transcriptional regulator [Halobacterium salinarum]|uniref:MarR family transcriptional regulator n=1 Tax=Halobacterium TaxID=2239 RepID=UPI002554CA40|nr:MarR family transcriptional regulator [Halobacterium salinarum]MDL0128169.1 MarR family transcriptional regulator [Halobacterium salinarum]MDL0139847.1 MarR family transcriptional regulator [Halobacterium salinarum]